MPSSTTLAISLVFLALIVVAQFNVSSLLKGIASFDTTNDADSLRLRITQLQSELQAVELSRNRLQVQMDSLKNVTNDDKGTDSQVLASIAALQAQLDDVQQSKDTLELLVKSWMNWNSDPYLGSNSYPNLCKNSTKLDEFGCEKGPGKCPGLYDHPVCLDNFPPKDRECIVYDFGIRENPEFGQTLLNAPFYCKIFAFDPSPITEKWYKESSRSLHLRNNPNYTLFHYGAGGKDGNVKLGEYEWGQVSIVRFPLEIQKNCTNANVTGKDCQLDYYGHQRKVFQLPVRTLDSIMKELGHNHIDILKVDVEGSEYAFLEHALDHNNLDNVQQLTIEWHHYDFDSRYGGGSTPAINAIVALLNKIGFQQFYIHDDRGGWPGTSREYWEKGLTLRYNLASFLRVDKKSKKEAK